MLSCLRRLRVQWSLALRRARTIGFVLLGIQFFGFCWWSSVLTHHFALTWDFAAYEQAASLIGHGHLDPWSTVLSTSFVRNDYEFVIWLIAPLQRLWPHPMTLKVLQDLATVDAEAIALDWMCDIAAVPQTLAKLRDRIKPRDEVVAENGVAGGFAEN
jgi:hypothetical protein